MTYPPPPPLSLEWNVGQVSGGNIGVFVRENSKGRLEGNNIAGCKETGIYIAQGSELHVLSNEVHGCGRLGILCIDRGTRARLEENEVYGCAIGGISDQEGADSIIVNNRIHGNPQAGIIASDSRCRIEGNAIYLNCGGVVIRDNGDPTLAGNTIVNHVMV